MTALDAEYMTLSIEPILDAVKKVLSSADFTSISEYDLMSKLKEQGYFPFLDNHPGNNHALFCAHFLLYHVLYLWRDECHQARLADLEISALAIGLRKYTAGELAVVQHDPLREYYCNLENLLRTDEQAVSALLDDFWRRYCRQDQRTAALKVLDLADPVDDYVIKLQYRKLVMQHHPDRGGDKQRLQQLNEAVAKLLK